MTVNGIYEPSKYVITAGQVDFNIAFYFVSSGHIRARITDTTGVDTELTPGVDFNIVNTTLSTVLQQTVGYQMTIYLDMPFIQQTDYKNTGDLDLENIEASFDAATLERQQMKERLGRTLSAPVSSLPGVDFALPDYAPGEYFQWHPSLLKMRSILIPGAENRVTTSDYFIVKDLVSDIASAGSSRKRMVITNSQALTANMTVPENVSLDIKEGGMITGARTLTINGSIQAGNYQIFGSDVTVTGNPQIDKVNVKWFGAKGDKSNSDTAAIQRAINFVDSTYDLETVIYFPRGFYKHSELDASNSLKKVSFMGEAPRSVILIYIGAGGANSYSIQFPAAGKSFGKMENITIIGYDDTNPSGGIAEHNLVYQGSVDSQHRLVNCQFQKCFGDSIKYTGLITNIHVDHVRLDGIGGYCFSWAGGVGMEARPVSVEKFTVDNNITGAFATRAQALGYYDGTRWGKGVAFLGALSGAYLSFSNARIEMNKKMIADPSGRVSLFYSAATTGYPSLKLKNMGGFTQPADSGAVVRSVNNRTNFIGEDLFFYNMSSILEDTAGNVIHPFSAQDRISFHANKQQNQGLCIQGQFLEFRDGAPDSTVFNRYRKGDIIFDNTPVKGGNIGHVVTTPTTGYGVTSGSNITTAAVVTAGSAVISGLSGVLQNCMPRLNITVVGAGAAGADLLTYIVSADQVAGTITVNTAPSTSVNPATIKYTVPEFTKWGNIELLGTLVWDPGSLATGSGETSGTITVSGAVVGDFVLVAAPYDLQDCVATAYIQQNGLAEIRLQNFSGATRDFASGTWKVRVFKQ
jgi:hypothetical protein